VTGRDPGPVSSDADVGSAKIEQIVRELVADGASFKDVAAEFGFGRCEKCGKPVDDDDYTDCDLLPEEDTFGYLMCHGCIAAPGIDVQAAWAAAGSDASDQ